MEAGWSQKVDMGPLPLISTTPLGSRTNSGQSWRSSAVEGPTWTCSNSSNDNDAGGHSETLSCKAQSCRCAVLYTFYHAWCNQKSKALAPLDAAVPFADTEDPRGCLLKTPTAPEAPNT